MLPQRNGLSLQSPLSVLVFYLLLMDPCRGQSVLIGQLQPIVAKIGDDVILRCHLEPAADVAAMTLEWTRPDLDPEFVFVWRAGQDFVHAKHPSYQGRTSVFTDELKRGNISLKLSKVKPSDAGKYRCYVPDREKYCFVELVVDAVSSPVISLSGIDRDKGGLVLQCESAGWYPEPEVSWLDGEGHVLSAGPTETVRGPDDLYTVSSRVTVDKRHSNSFTCRVQQNHINQTREAHVIILDDFFEVQSSTSIITGLAVGLAFCILLNFAAAFFLLKQRQFIVKTNRSCSDETNEEKKKKRSVTNKSEEQFATEEEMKTLKEKEEKSTNKQMSEQQQRRQEAERKVQDLEEDLRTKKNEVGFKQAQLLRIDEEMQKNKKELQSLKEELENKRKELEGIQCSTLRNNIHLSRSKEEQKKEDVDKLMVTVETQQTVLNNKIKEYEDKHAEVEQLQKEIQRIQINLQTLKEDPESKDTEMEDRQQTELKGRKTSDVLMENDNQETSQLMSHSHTSSCEAQQQHHTSWIRQSSAAVFVIKLSQSGEFFCLTNNSNEDQKMGRWKLNFIFNDKLPVILTFGPTFHLKAGESFTKWASDHNQRCTVSDQLWKELKSWRQEDRLRVAISSEAGESRSIQGIVIEAQ